jgi:hypothetical protein
MSIAALHLLENKHLSLEISRAHRFGVLGLVSPFEILSRVRRSDIK